MGISDGVADLHIHTTASDGTSSVDQRIAQAHEQDLEAIAITDHDTIADPLSEPVGHYDDLELITGVEVRADVQNTKVELLGYYVDPTDAQLADVLEQIRGYRRKRNQQIIAQLREKTSLERPYEDIRTEADGILGRPHIATVLVEDGIVDSVGAAFREYLANEGEAFVPMERVSARTVLRTVQDAGGVVSLAHPGRIRTDDIEGIITELVSDGLDAIEVGYPYRESPSEAYANVTASDAAAFAEKFDLLQTGGSDCHGPGSGKFRIGQVCVTRPHLDALRQCATERRAF